MDNALKAISQTEDEIRVGNYIVMFGGRDMTGVPVEGFNTGPKNADGSAGEWFDKDTQIESQFTALGKIPLDWEHSRNPEGIDVGMLGFVDWTTKSVDDTGVFVERVLYRHNKYVNAIKQLIDFGVVGSSVEPNQRKIKSASNGRIESFPIIRDTLTVTPMDIRMLDENVIQAFKALGLAETQEPEATPEGSNAGDAVKASDVGINEDDSHINGGIEMEKEETPQVDVAAIAKAAAEEAVKAYRKQLEAEPAVKSAGVLVEGPVVVTHDEADNPFTSLAEQARAVKSAAAGYKADSRLRRLALKAPTGASEGTPSTGGFMVDPTLSPDIMKPLHEEGPFTKLARKMPVGGNSNYGWINGVDETSRADGSRWGGIRGYRLAEGADKTASKPSFRRINWELKKYAVLVYATDELLADASLFSTIVRQGSGEELMFMANDDILNGAGTGGPAGILNSGALVAVAKETGQAADTIVTENLNRMWSRMHPRSKAKAAWYVNTDVMTQLDDLVLNSAAGYLEPRFIRYGADGVMTMRGKPVYETEFNASVGTVGDVVLADMSEYLFWEKGGVQAAVSIHVNFVGDETVFRFVYRCDGQTSMASPLTPYKGTGNTLSSFVALASRD